MPRYLFPRRVMWDKGFGGWVTRRWRFPPGRWSEWRPGTVAELARLQAAHLPALWAFELENREYFAASVPDRGDDFFAEFMTRHDELLERQAEGSMILHVVVESDGSVVGRVNLFEVSEGTADLGYRIAERVSGAGVATEFVRQVCSLAANDYGLVTLHASARTENVGSRIVLERTGFVAIGEVTLSGRPGIRYRRDLADLARGGEISS